MVAPENVPHKANVGRGMTARGFACGVEALTEAGRDSDNDIGEVDGSDNNKDDDFKSTN